MKMAFRGQTPKRGARRLPVSALFVFAVVALISASGGTHRVRGVMSAVCVLSPVESTSPPWLIELQFPSTPVPHLWQAHPSNFPVKKFGGANSNSEGNYRWDMTELE